MINENSLASDISNDENLALHELGKQHLDAATEALGKGNSDTVLFHLSTAQELLRPASHRHPEIAAAIKKLTATPELVHEPISSLELELSAEEAVAKLEQMFADEYHHAINLVRKRLSDGNFWEIDAFFAGASLHYVTITHASPEALFPLLYAVIDHYSKDCWSYSSFAGCEDKLRHLISV